MEEALKRRLGGRSDLMVSPVGLGCWQFSLGRGPGGSYWPSLEGATVRDIVQVSLEGGVNWFDTAEAYGWGASERALSSSLQAAGKQPGEEVIVATKWSPVFRTAGNIPSTIGRRLENLAPYPIDLYQIHNAASFSSIPAQMKAMARLVREGKIRHVGVSNFSAKAMREAHSVLADLGLPLVSNQVDYSLLNRKIETSGVLAAALDLGISIIAYSPLAQGVLSGRFHDDPGQLHAIKGFRRLRGFYRRSTLEKSRPVIDALKEIAQNHAPATAAQVALRWLLDAHGEPVVVIPGATKRSQAVSNAAVMSFSLATDEIDRLNQVSDGWR